MLEIIEQKYNLIDKSSWDRGEWDNEPDLVRLIDGTTPFLIRRGPDTLGHLCGYFGVFESSKLFGKFCDDMQDFNIELTFAGRWYDQSSIVWWFGWDHAHLGDLVPGMLALYKRRHSYGMESEGGETYKSVSYVIDEMELINEKLKQINHDSRNRYHKQNHKGKRNSKP